MDNRQHNKTIQPTRMQAFLSKISEPLSKAAYDYKAKIGQALSPNYFKGFEDEDVAAQKRIARRRAKNKVARASRKANRR